MSNTIIIKINCGFAMKITTLGDQSNSTSPKYQNTPQLPKIPNMNKKYNGGRRVISTIRCNQTLFILCLFPLNSLSSSSSSIPIIIGNDNCHHCVMILFSPCQY